jgi:hypothetical protein
MVSSVSSTSAAVPTSSTTASPTAAADKTLNMLLQSSDVLQALASHSQAYLPPTVNLVLSTLWGGINVNRSRTIGENDLQNFIVSEGGKASDAHALWLQLNPPDAKGKTASTINAANFAFNSYLSRAISSNLKSILASVKDIQQKQGPNANISLLSTFDVLGTSPIGSGIFINVFV